ncbi:MAG: hypothetical protein ABIR46_00750 [Candidatus Saccharimonadales bacterium]
MNLNGMFRELALGELSNLALSEGGTIIAEKRPQIVNYINEGLLALYSKFVLKEIDMLIEMREALTNYHLLRRYAVSQYSDENPPDRWNLPYIIDNVGEPFQEDVIKILSVYNSFGMKIPLNDIENPLSVFSPQSTVLQVPYPIAGQALSLEYQARHKILDHCNCDEEIYLPDVLHSALRAHVASKVFMHMNTQENTAKGQEHMIIYDIICNDVVEKDLVNTSSSTTNVKFDKRGWR